jgi:hypothetical protein
MADDKKGVMLFMGQTEPFSVRGVCAEELPKVVGLGR